MNRRAAISEHRSEPLLPLRAFFSRTLRHGGLALHRLHLGDEAAPPD
jgi:hypothetical protein